MDTAGLPQTQLLQLAISTSDRCDQPGSQDRDDEAESTPVINTSPTETKTTASSCQDQEEVQGPQQRLSVGVPVVPAAESSLVSSVHQVGGQGEGRVQAGGQQGGVQTVGSPQEQA